MWLGMHAHDRRREHEPHTTQSQQPTRKKLTQETKVPKKDRTPALPQGPRAAQQQQPPRAHPVASTHVHKRRALKSGPQQTQPQHTRAREQKVSKHKQAQMTPTQTKAQTRDRTLTQTQHKEKRIRVEQEKSKGTAKRPSTAATVPASALASAVASETAVMETVPMQVDVRGYACKAVLPSQQLLSPPMGVEPAMEDMR